MDLAALHACSHGQSALPVIPHVLAYQLAPEAGIGVPAQPIGRPATLDVRGPGQGPAQPHTPAGQDGFPHVALEDHLGGARLCLGGHVAPEVRGGSDVDPLEKVGPLHHHGLEELLHGTASAHHGGLTGEDARHVMGVVGEVGSPTSQVRHLLEQGAIHVSPQAHGGDRDGFAAHGLGQIGDADLLGLSVRQEDHMLDPRARPARRRTGEAAIARTIGSRAPAATGRRQ